MWESFEQCAGSEKQMSISHLMIHKERMFNLLEISLPILWKRSLSNCSSGMSADDAMSCTICVLLLADSRQLIGQFCPEMLAVLEQTIAADDQPDFRERIICFMASIINGRDFPLLDASADSHLARFLMSCSSDATDANLLTRAIAKELKLCKLLLSIACEEQDALGAVRLQDAIFVIVEAVAKLLLSMYGNSSRQDTGGDSILREWIELLPFMKTLTWKFVENILPYFHQLTDIIEVISCAILIYIAYVISFFVTEPLR